MNMFSNIIKVLTCVTCVSLTSICTATTFNIKHIEPLSWWTNMQSNDLQIMVHGEGIGALTPEFSHAALTINHVHRPKNPNYLFIDVTLSDALKPGDYALDFYLDQRKVLTKQYRFNSRNRHSAAAQSFTPRDVIYLVTPDRFANGDQNNDQVAYLSEGVARNEKGGRHGGDIQGIINQLEYIAEMGFSQLWTNPMIENNQPSYSYHGYSATNFYKIDPRFGTNELYRQLSDKAQEKGIGLIKDVVLNHIGSKHWWLTDLPMDNWLNYQNQPYTGTHHRRESLHDPHATNKDQALFANGWFVPSMPDLNQTNPFVSTYLIQNTLWWIEFANLSGLRVDTYSYSDKNFLTAWTKRITTEYPNINIVGEEWTTNPAIVAYWQRGKMNQDGYQSYLPSVMDFPFQDALVNALTQQESWNAGLTQLYQSLANDFLYADPYNLVTFTDNHDMSRIYTQLNEDMALYKMAMSILFTTRGIPQVFYGTEIAMTNRGTDDHGIIRSDFPGGWQKDHANVFKRQHLTKTQAEALAFTKTILNWRKQAPAIHQGKLVHYAPNEGVYVYGRLLNDHQKVMVIVNKNTQPVTFNPTDFAEIIGASTQALNALNDEVFSLSAPFKVPEKTALILSLIR